MLAFGPIPSRRLGFSLGINNIPPKHCPYSCVYCQVDRTTALEVKRRDFYPVEQVVCEVKQKISEAARAGRTVDYLTFVPDGEPALDNGPGKLIEALKAFHIPIAVISNASLISEPSVQADLLLADWVSLKVDAVAEREWRQINRPHRHLSLAAILDGILQFRERFWGELVTETMLVEGINDSETVIEALYVFLLRLKPDKAYLSIPTRPPAEAWVKAPGAGALQRILAKAPEKIPFMDLLFETDVSGFVSTGNFEEDILNITAVHPLREEALQKMAAQAGADWSTVEALLTAGKIRRIPYREENFYVRNFTGTKPR